MKIPSINWPCLARDAAQTLLPLALAIAVAQGGNWLALLLGMPWLAVAGVLGGICLCGLGLQRIMRRVIFPGIDLLGAFKAALEADPGRAWQGLCMVVAALILALSGGVAKAAELPPGAIKHLPTLRAEQRALWPDMPLPSALAAQVEQESCISLKHPRCWDPRSQLKTSREQGVGFGQITRAWRADGSLRFDSLAELRSQFPRELGAWSWDSPTLYDPAFQLRAMILMDLRNWHAVRGTATEDDRLRMTLASYNGGLRGLANDRALCGGTPGCDSSRWVGHVEATCTKSQTAVAGYRLSWCQINREYPALILGPRRAKYVQAMEA